MRSINVIYFVIVWLCLSSLNIQIQAQGKTIYLKELWDSVKVCENPHKGWYHHFYGDAFSYDIKNDEDLDNFPGLDHLYIRVYWSMLEPTEGHFDWSIIENCKEKWVSKGYGIAICVTNKEQMEYATPEWVRLAGAKGEFLTCFGKKLWQPDYSDSIFLAKLDAFHKAFADRYDGQPWLVYVGIGSIGMWGEGHAYPCGPAASVDAVKKHIDIYVKNYKKTHLVISDDYAQHNRPNEEEKQIKEYVESKSISWADWTPMVGFYIEHNPGTFSVVKPDYFLETYKKRPTIIECEHYSIVKKQNNWIGKDGSIKGADMLRGAIGIIHPTYIGYHGYADEFLKENPNFVKEIANKCGYWYFPASIAIPSLLKPGLTSTWRIAWENHGVAPGYNRYSLEMKIEGISTAIFKLPESDNRTWENGKCETEYYKVTIPQSLKPGTYKVSFRLYDPLTKRNVELALKNDIRDENGYYLFAKIVIHK